ncbi:MAG: hypothetical protein MZV65_15370 [Chromatiales bacterium]|nr:hypothetical protein [Chromatiales bacterium]
MNPGARPVPAVALDRFGLLCAVLAAVGFSFKAILVKLAYRYGVDAETLLALRMAFSLPFFVVLGGIGAHRAPSGADAARLGLVVRAGSVGLLSGELSRLSRSAIHQRRARTARSCSSTRRWWCSSRPYGSANRSRAGR